jgi:hypothetical protein
MTVDLLTSPIEYLLNELQVYLFANWRLLALFIIIFAIVICMANGLDLETTIILITPMMVGMIVTSLYLPKIMWIFIILFASILWIIFGLQLIGQRN